MNYVIYCHINLKNGKRYVGWALMTSALDTHQSMMRRWRDHLSDVRCGSQNYFHNAIRKWGSGDDVWKHEVLDVMTTLTGAKHAEVLWIAQRRTFTYDSDGWGYNETRGGDGVSGYVLTPEIRQKLSNASKNAWKDPIYRAKIEEILASARANKTSEMRSDEQLKRWQNPTMLQQARDLAALRPRQGGRFVKWSSQTHDDVDKLRRARKGKP